MTRRRFPEGFLWGAATAGHQIEGDNDNSDIWFLEQQTPSVFREPSGKACNSWEMWDDDLQLVASLGLNAYRFSVEWARVEPAPGAYSVEALDHYGAMVDRCRELGLAPVVTFNHFTTPHWFAMRGGFLDAGCTAGLRRLLLPRDGGVRRPHRVRRHVERAEPVPDAGLDRPAGFRARPRTLDPGCGEPSAGVERYRVSNVVLPEDFDAMQAGLTAAHHAAKAAIKTERADLPVGLSIAMIDDQVVGDDASLRDRKRADVYDHWLDVAAGDDFVGVQNYERRWYDADREVVPDPDAPKNDMGSAVDPASLAGAVRYAFERAGVPIMVTEHGLSTHDDELRAGFIPPSLAGLHDAMADGVPVLGYMHWSLLDNFEWIFGFDGQLGLVSVDRSTFERTPKPSADVYSRIALANAVEY